MNLLGKAQLEELGEALLDFSQIGDLVVWLDADSRSQSATQTTAIVSWNCRT